MGEDVALEIDAGGDFDQAQAVVVEPENGALGNVQDALAALARIGAAEGQVIDPIDELGGLTLDDDR